MDVKIVKWIGIVLMLIGSFLIGFYPLGYWFSHPELTQMQVSIKLIGWILVGFFCAMVGFIMHRIDYVRRP